MDEEIVEKQINCLFEDIKIDAVKIGMVFNTIISVIADCLKKNQAENIVLTRLWFQKAAIIYSNRRLRNSW